MGVLKISKTTLPELLIFTQQHVYIVKILNCDLQTYTGAPKGVSSFVEIYKEKV